MALTQMFAGAGLTLAIVGVYAVTGFMVYRRRHELAIRGALGASPRQVFAHIASNGAAVGIGALRAVKFDPLRALKDQ